MMVGYGLTLAVFLKRFAKARQGATAVEFALLAFPFLGLLLAILETTFVFLAHQVLESAVQDSARFIRTGEAQTFSITDFRQRVCNSTYGLFNCAQLHIDVREINNFQAASFSSPIDPITGNWVIPQTFDPGGSSSIVLSRVYYKWPLFMDFLGMTLEDQAGGNTRLLGSNTVVKNEPF